MTAFKRGALEPIPTNVPPTKKDVDPSMFVDIEHADDKQIRIFRMWFTIKMKMSLINWYSKKQYTIETSVFGAEFVAMKISVTTLDAIK